MCLVTSERIRVGIVGHGAQLFPTEADLSATVCPGSVQRELLWRGCASAKGAGCVMIGPQEEADAVSFTQA